MTSIVARNLSSQSTLVRRKAPKVIIPCQRFYATNKKEADVATLILLRHGQSVWNATPTFSGWCDVPLSDRGIAEAKAAGELLKERGYTDIDVAFTSTLQRAIVTCELALEAASPDTPIIQAWQLNERHYGALQGKRKDDENLLQKYGQEQLKQWRRDFDATPPALDESHEYHQPPPAPLTESLADCQQRVLAFWHDEIALALIPRRTVLLAAHSNTLRALVSYLDRVEPEHVPNIHIPNSIPCVYHFDDEQNVVSDLLQSQSGGSRGHWIFSVENQERLRKKIGGRQSMMRAIFQAWDVDGDGVLTVQERMNGLRTLMGGDDIAIAALASKILEELEQEMEEKGQVPSLKPGEWEERALDAIRKHMPELLEQ